VVQIGEQGKSHTQAIIPALQLRSISLPPPTFKAINRALSLFEAHGSDHGATPGSDAGAEKLRRYVPIVLDAPALISLKREEVFCLRPRLEGALKGLDGRHSPASGLGAMGTANREPEVNQTTTKPAARCTDSPCAFFF